MAKPLQPKASKVDWGNFELATPDEDIRSLIGASSGEAGSGKTYFWLTAPEPIAYFLFDPAGLKGLKGNKMFKGMDLRFIDYSAKFNPGAIEDESERVQRAIDVLGQFREDWKVGIRNARTLVTDKEDFLWELIRYAHDEVRSPNPLNFGEQNLLYRGLFTEAEANKRNFGLIRGLRKKWGATGPGKQGFTGEVEPRGQKEVTEWVQVNLFHRWDRKTRQFLVEIQDKCRVGDAINLMGVEEPMDFLTLALKLVPESEPSEWGFE